MLEVSYLPFVYATPCRDTDPCLWPDHQLLTANFFQLPHMCSSQKHLLTEQWEKTELPSIKQIHLPFHINTPCQRFKVLLLQF